MTTDPFYGGLPGGGNGREAPEPEVRLLPVAAWPPAHAVLVCEFAVIGEPKPAGSKTSGVATRMENGRRVPIINPETGLPKTFTKDSSGAAGKSWRNDVTAAGVKYRRIDEPLDGRLAVEFVFIVPWKPGDYGKRDGRLKASVRVAPHVRPDALKLGRAVEDALTSILWTDDARITEELLRKVHVAPKDGPQRAQVRLWKLPTTIGDLRDLMAERYEGESDEEPDEEPQQLALG